MPQAKKAKKAKKGVAKKAKKVAVAQTDDEEKIIKVVCSASDFLELGDIPGNETNPRIIKDAALDRLKTSLKPGVFKPFIVRKNEAGETELLAGNQRRRGLMTLRDDGWFVPPLPVSWVDVTDTEAKRIILRDNVNDGEWEMDGYSRYVVELSRTYGTKTADFLGMEMKDYGNIMEHYATLESAAGEAGGGVEGMEARKQRLVEHFEATGLDTIQAERQAEMYMMSGDDPNEWHGEAGKPQMKGTTGKRYELTFWFDAVESLELVSKAFSQPRTTELDGVRLTRIAANILKDMPVMEAKPVKKAVKKAKK